MDKYEQCPLVNLTEHFYVGSYSLLVTKTLLTKVTINVITLPLIVTYLFK